jgi:hypothetical protein
VGFVLRLALRRGLLGGSSFWKVLGTLAMAMRLLRKLTRNEPEVVYREVLQPGQSLVISNDKTARVVRRRR